jgi:hypothetical protein
MDPKRTRDPSFFFPFARLVQLSFPNPLRTTAPRLSSVRGRVGGGCRVVLAAASSPRRWTMCVGAGRSARRPSALSRGGLWVGLGPRRRFSCAGGRRGAAVVAD